MKRYVIISILLLLTFAAGAQTKSKYQIGGPEESYNMVKVTNQTHFSDFSCVVYFLQEKDGKHVVESTLGVFSMKGFGDHDSNKVRIRAGQWIGVKIPEEMADVTVNLSYKDLPCFDIVEITLTDSKGSSVGEEF